jgi:AcrR family transcriptional regulator
MESSQATMPGPAGARLAPADRHRHLIEVARAIVEQRGTAALSMETVAKEAGVSRALVYAYFDNRAGLIRALWDELADIWAVEPMAPVAALIGDASPRELFEQRLIENTRWLFDQIEVRGLLYHRLMSEPQLESSIEAFRTRIHDANLHWWADLVAAIGIDADRALVYSSIFNSASEMLWSLVARGDVDREIVEEVVLTSARAALDALLESAGRAAGAAPR